MTPAHFADYIEIGRAVISHILNGRNKPSLEVITKILTKIDYIDSNWLLTGEGNMLRNDFTPKSSTERTMLNVTKQTDLFDNIQMPENDISNTSVNNTNVKRKENELSRPKIEDKYLNNQQIIYQNKVDKKITKIIIYYSDNTFETFNPENMDLKK